jgi:hypothetical protein
MKIAFIYTGQARTFKEVIENHLWFAFRHFDKPTVFASMADDPQAEDLLLLRDHGYTVHFEKVVQPEIPEPATRPHQFGYPRSVSAQSVLKQLWALNRAWEFFNEKREGDYDLIVRIRPDSRFVRFELPKSYRLQALLYSSQTGADGLNWREGIKPYLCLVPWWASWGGINDRLAVMGRDAAKAYFTAYTKIDELVAKKCPVHPETMIAAALDMAKITPERMLPAEFMTLRMDGATTPIDMTMIDLAEYTRIR